MHRVEGGRTGNSGGSASFGSTRPGFAVGALLAAVLLLVFVGVPSVQARSPLAGFVVEPSRIPGVPGMMPVEGATVTIQGTKLSDTTGANGGFQIPGAPGGEVVLEARAPGYAPVSKRVRMTGNATSDIVVLLIKPEGTRPIPAFARQSVYVAFADEDWFKPRDPASPDRDVPRPLWDISPNLSYLGAILWGGDPFGFGSHPPSIPSSPDATPVSAARNSIMVFDPRAPQKVHYLEASVPPFWTVFDASGTRLFVASAHNLIHVYDVAKNKAVRQARCPGPVVDLVRGGDRIYALVMGAGKMLALDGQGQLLETTSLERGRPQTLAADATGRVYVSLQVPGPKRVGEIRAFEGSREVARTVTPDVALGMALSPDGRFLIAADQRSAVTVRDARTLQAVASIPAGITPCRISVAPDGTRAWVSCRGSNAVHVVDLRTLTAAGSIDVDADPMGLAVTGDGARLYVACRGRSTICVVDTANGTVLERTTPQPLSRPTGVTISP